MQGHDIAPLYLANAKPEWRTDFFYEHATIRDKDFIPASQALMTKEWKYFLWPEFGREQLFHVSADPLEETDLIGDSAQAGRLAAMRKRFNELKVAAP